MITEGLSRIWFPPGEPEPREYFNETEKELTLNYTSCFGEPKAIEYYYKTGKLTKKALKGVGTCFACKKDDFLKFRKDLKGWDKNRLWTTYWQPKNKKPYWINSNIEKVFTVCYTEEETQINVIEKAIIFLQSIKDVK